MKLLAIGDFHGKLPKKFGKIIKKEKVDLVVSVGDYAPFYYRDLWFKHCFRKEIELWEVIGKKRYKKLVTNDHSLGERVLKKLDKLPVPVFTVLGNVDYPRADDVADFHLKKKKNKWSWAEKEHILFSQRIKKYHNIKRIDYSFAEYKGFVFIGMRGHSFPGKVKSRSFKKRKEVLNKLFRKFKKENKQGKVICVSHTPPKNTKLDKISMKALKEVRGKHFGSKLTLKLYFHLQEKARRFFDGGI